MKYICNNCGYIYHDEIETIQFKDLNDDYICPICFMPIELFSKYDESNEDFYLF